MSQRTIHPDIGEAIDVLENLLANQLQKHASMLPQEARRAASSIRNGLSLEGVGFTVPFSDSSEDQTEP